MKLYILILAFISFILTQENQQYPIKQYTLAILRSGWGGRIRTYGTRYQKPATWIISVNSRRWSSVNKLLQ